MHNSSTHIAFTDGTSSAAEQPVIETSSPSNTLASVMANWVVVTVPTNNVAPTNGSRPPAFDAPIGSNVR